MTPREVLAHCLLMGRDVYPSPEDQADGILKRLKSEGLFIGPLVATPEMAEQGAGEIDWREISPTPPTVMAADVWRSMTAEWQRDEGA